MYNLFQDNFRSERFNATVLPSGHRVPGVCGSSRRSGKRANHLSARKLHRNQPGEQICHLRRHSVPNPEPDIRRARSRASAGAGGTLATVLLGAKGSGVRRTSCRGAPAASAQRSMPVRAKGDPVFRIALSISGMLYACRYSFPLRVRIRPLGERSTNPSRNRYGS